MIEIKEKSKCCGCTACSSVCPKQCIEMREDEEGFYYPFVNKEACIDCGLCQKTCPVLSPPDTTGEPVRTCIVRNKNEEILMRSTSGGFFYALCEYVIQKGGVVYGVRLNDKLEVVHSRAETIEDCVPFLGSKYVQSYLGNIFRQVKKDLDGGRLVCFSGTPCQVQGLRNTLNNEQRDCLILVDITCHGVPSQKIWKEYLDYERNRIQEDIVDVSFRSKHFGYNNSSMKIGGHDSVKYETARVNPFLKAFFSHMFLRPSCSHCPVKTIHRTSDFTIFDSWKASEVLHQKDDDKGYTNVLVQTDKGLKIIDSLRDRLDIHDVTIKDIIPDDGGMMLRSANPHPSRDAYIRDINEKGYEYATDHYMKITAKDTLIEKAKLIVRHSAIIRKLARAKRDIFRVK